MKREEGWFLGPVKSSVVVSLDLGVVVVLDEAKTFLLDLAVRESRVADSAAEFTSRSFDE